jgi:hypothetical protein
MSTQASDETAPSIQSLADASELSKPGKRLDLLNKTESAQNRSKGRLNIASTFLGLKK